MALPKFQSPFPPVELGYDDKKELCRIAKRVVDDTVHAYEHFVWTDGCEVSPTRYVVLRSSDDMVVHQERRGGATDGRSRDVEALLTVGSVVGTLDDAMYGVLSPTTEAMRLKAAYMNELSSLGNCAVLATVQEPKADKPFRSLTLKWLVRTLPMPARAVMKPRDKVFIEATGIKTLANGERIGFQLIHSIDHLASLRALPSFVRSSVSTCAIWRQQSATKVQVYVKSFLALPERLFASVALKMASESLVATWRHVHCAQMKKLAWQLRRALPSLDETKRVGGTADKESDKDKDKVVHRCRVCTAKAKTLCLVCAKAVCSKCRAQRELWSLEVGGLGGTDGELVEQRVAFCVPCLTVAIRQSAADVARDEIPDRGDVFKAPNSTRSRRVGGTGGGRGRGSGSSGSGSSSGKSRVNGYGRRESGSSSTSSERTQDTMDSMSRTSSKPHMTLSM